MSIRAGNRLKFIPWLLELASGDRPVDPDWKVVYDLAKDLQRDFDDYNDDQAQAEYFEAKGDMYHADEWRDFNKGVADRAWGPIQLYAYLQRKGACYDALAACDTAASLWAANPVLYSDRPPASGGVYAMESGGLIKVGRARNVAKRFQSLKTGCPGGLRYLGLLSSDPDEEAKFHARYKAQRVQGEWFTRAGLLAKDLEALGV